MKKKIISSLLVALMIAGTSYFSVSAVMANGTIVIGNKSFDLTYANDTKNLTEVSNEIIKGGAIYVKDFAGNWIDNNTGLTVNSSLIPDEETVVVATVKANTFGAIVNATSTKGDATKYQIFDGTKAISAISNLGTDTIIFPVKGVGDIVTIKLLNAGGTIIATTDVTLVAPVTEPITPVNTVNSRQNPANLGELINMTTTTLDKKVSKSEVIVKDIIRGDEALTLIKATNRFNNAPKDGYEYILAKISFKLVKAIDINTQFNLSEFNFKMVSSSGKDYDFVSVVVPKPSIDANLYEGSSNEGYAVFMVEKTDNKPLITYGRAYDGTGGVWFKGYKDSVNYISKITITSTKLVTYIDGTNQIGKLTYKVENQLGADITNTSLANNLTFESGVGSVTGSKGVITLTAPNDVSFTQLGTVKITVRDSSSGLLTSVPLTLETQKNNLTATISNLQELQTYLTTNFSQLQTSIGTAKFTFVVYDNQNSFIAHDYWIMVKYDYNFFEGAMTSIKYTSEQKDILRSELKNFQEKIGTTIVSAMPNKKVYGGYYDSWYKYPSLQMDLQTRRYYSWRNYDEVQTSDINKIYENAKPSTFRWYSLIDNNL